MQNKLIWLGLLLALGAAVAVRPRGIRNNNPGNIRDVGIKWRGLVGRDSAGYAVFASAVDGIRAMYIDLRTGFRRDGEDTIREIIAEWAPAHENPTSRYIEFISQRLGVGPDEVLELERVRVPLIESIIQFENGQQPYTRALINDAIAAAA